jgi:hypothetical protein
MKINPINNTNQNTNFNARIAPNPEWDNILRYLEKYPYPKGMQKPASDKELMDKFIKAVEANPSDALINIDTFVCQKGEFYNTRGRISSQYGEFRDTEPARDDSEAPFENIIRRILNPENRTQMCKLFGTNDFAEQSKWWNKYIDSIWNDIQEVFYEETVYPKSYDKIWNLKFREQNPV